MNSEASEVREVSPGYGFTAAKPALPVGYKQTEVGVIPKDWDVLKFGSLAEIVRGKFSARPRNDPRFYGGDYPFLQTGDVTRSGSKISSFTQTLNEEGVKVSRLFPKGTLFFTIAANIGDVGISEFEAACPDSLVAISPNSIVDKVWLLYELASRKENFEALASPGAQLNINLEKLRPYLLPVPPLDEQRAIATALSEVDLLLEELDRLIAKKRDIKQAIMQQLLTGQTRLPGFEGKWEIKKLKEIAHIKTGSRNNENKLKDGDYPFFVRSEFVERINSYSYDCEAILVPGEGRIGNIFHYIKGKFDVHQRVYAITQFNVDVSPQFIYFFMTLKFGAWAMQNTVKATVDSLRLPTFHTFEIVLPPTKDEQTAIAIVLSNMVYEIEALEKRYAKTAAIKQAMMQTLLTGRTRLINSAG